MTISLHRTFIPTINKKLKTLILIMKKYLLPLVCLLTTFDCLAAFQLSFAGRGALGKAGNENSSSLKTRDFYVYGAEAKLGYSFGRFIIGGSADYNLWKQKTEPSEVSNSNMSGKQLSLSPIVGMDLGPISLIGKLIVSSNVDLDKTSLSGDKTSYTSPSLPSYAVQLNYRPSGSRSFLGFEYTNLSYEKIESGSTSTTLTSNDKINYSSYGLIYGFIF